MALDAEPLAIVHWLTLYLRDHPRAADTADGIATWWLAEHSPINEAHLTAALAWMQINGLVERIGAVDGRVRYHRAAGLPDLELALQSALTNDGVSGQ